jgi:hypothetical protein
VLATLVAAVSLVLAPAAHAERVLVKFRTGVTPERAHALLERHGASVRRTIGGIGVRVVDAPSAGSLRSAPGIEFAEPDGRALPQETIPDDPYFPQGNYALGGGAWGWYRSHTTDAWDVTRGDAAVTIAVLDTGLRTAGLDFGGQVLSGWNVLTGTPDTSSNAGAHGTYVAGVAGLAGGNGAGNAGYCPGCRIMPVQVGTDSGADYSNLASGVTWAVDHGARVINLSWAGLTASATLANAVAYARSKGAVVFAAAGNSNCDCVTYPAATPGVLGVGGVGNAGAKAGDSNYGSWVALAAPEGNMTASPSINGAPGYAQVGGTSLAAPAAAGIAALALSAQPSLTGAGLEQAIESSAKAASFSVAYGEIDALALLQAVGAGPAPAASPPVNTAAPRVLLGTNGVYNTAPLAAAPQVGQVLLRGQGAWTGASGLTLSAVQWQRCATDGTACTSVGASYKYTVQSADTGRPLRVVITMRNGAGSTTLASALTAPVGGTATTQAPASTSAPVVSGTAQSGQTLTASTGTWNGSPTAYAYEWRRCDASGTGCSAIAGATASSYAVGDGDVGATLRVAVSASNAGGSTTATSAPTGAVAAAPVQPATQSLTFSGSLGAKGGSQSFAVTAAAGATHATLTFTRCSSLMLTLTSGSTVLGSVSGASGLVLDRDVAAGPLSYVVSGSSRCSFTLAVTTAA